MSKATVLFGKLKKRLSALEHLLPNPTPTNLYTQQDQDRMLGYRLLCHAELEGFFEALVLLAVDEVWPKAKRLQQISPAAQDLMDYRDRVLYPPKKVSAPPVADLKRLEEAVQDLTNKVSKNMGITEKDILKLFLPLGIDHSALDIQWLKALDYLGECRGDVAHNPWENATYAETNPQSEKKSIQDVLDGIPDLIKLIDQFIARV
ncbi:HEPN domain-containing protein [Streptomyces olivaceiscleroticus]|uniref:HEPN domain-containing protein n=1 Tax=Streptomyces olivaceiscleroticus TaxID=68245 RepID=A0ABP3LBK9_9ACTN